MSGDVAVEEPDPQTVPEEQQPRARPLVMLEADDVPACAVDGTCW